MTWTVVGELHDFPTDVPIAVVAEGVPICMVHTGGEVYAVHDECTHAAVPLSEGEVSECTIECLMHGSRFDLRTGATLNLPATKAVRTYPVRVIDGQVQIAAT